MNVSSKHEFASGRSSSLLRRGSSWGEPLGNARAASKSVAEGQTVIVTPAQLLLEELMREKLLLPDDLDGLNEDQLTALYATTERKQALAQLVEFGLLTPYQAERIESGKLHGLVLGNYRVLDRIGSGGMGTVYKAEHIQLRRLAAVKIVAIHTERGDWQRLFMRFRSEIRAVAQLRHPNIVQALDAGEIPPPDSESPALCYYVMEFVQGQDLETLVNQQGPLPIGQACEVIYQVASALHEIHCHRLVHRDIKPSNIVLTAEGKAKLLDFGLVRHLRHRVTEVGTVLGTVDYMAPEQASDASSVDIRADIYSLGGTLFWCLTGRQPFPSQGNLAEDLLLRRKQMPPSARALRPEIPPGLDAVIATMLHPDREKRYPEPKAVMNALVPYLRLEQVSAVLQPSHAGDSGKAKRTSSQETKRILIIDDELPIREFCRHALQQDGFSCETAENADQGLALISSKPFDLILLDWNLPDIEGPEVVARVRAMSVSPYLKIVMISGRISGEELSRALMHGADDYLCKPFSLQEMLSRVKAALALKEAQETMQAMMSYLADANARLEQNLTSTSGELAQLQNILVQMMALAINYRDASARRHPQRMARYARRLAEAASLLPAFAGEIDEQYLRHLEVAIPLHDLGKVGLPDHIRFKDTLLSPEERLLMQTHTIIGHEILTEAAKQYQGRTFDFIRMAAEIARHHHERYDGNGYPDGLAGKDIPLSARITAICDTYDALCSPRPYRPALPHEAAVLMILKNSPGQFDPDLLVAFEQVAADFAAIFRELPPN